MSRPALPRLLFLLAATVAVCVAAPSRGADAPAAAPRPNILFILADDLGWADVGFNGGEIKTPNIDQIAARGAKLAQFYVQPVCSPTRAALMTGRYPIRLGMQVSVVRPWAQHGLPLEERTLPHALKEAGYETAICGKWHLGHVRPEYLPTRRGFDHQYGHYNGALDHFTHVRDGGFDWHKDDKVSRDEGYSTFLIAKEAVRLIDAKDQAKPLFLYVPFTAVHAPLQVPPKYTEPYAHLKEPRRTYAGMIAAMDEAVGSILAALDRKGIRKDTLIVFSSDNGGPAPGRVTSNGPFRAGKGTLYEGGTRVCAAAAWEGHIKPGTIVDQPLHMVDWYPTLLKLAGAPAGQKLPPDGRDAWPTIAHGRPSPHEQILLNASPANGAIRVGDWKLVINGNRRDADDGGPQADGGGAGGAGGAGAQPAAPKRAKKAAGAGEGGGGGTGGGGADAVELFDLAKDPSEKTNLAAEQPAKVKELRARYDVLAAEAVPPKGGPPPKGFKSPKVWGEPD